MIRKSFVVASLIAMLLSACAGQAPTQTAVPTSSDAPVAATTGAPAALPTDTLVAETPASLSTDTSTPGTPAPTNPPDCTNLAAFVTDVTIPDNSNVVGGSVFTKTWRVSNTGTCVWGPDYTLTHYSDEQMSAPESVPLNVTRPGETLDISIDLRAANSVGTHRGNFVIKNPAGLIMQIDNDSRLWVIITVTNIVSATATLNSTSTPANGSAISTSTNSTSDDNDSGFAPATCSTSTDSAKLTDTLNAINAYRAQNGLPEYKLNIRLARAAQAHANDMACNKLFVHTGSDKSTPQTRGMTSGYEASVVTENVYGSYPPLTGQGAVSWWINDKTDLRHNENLLSNIYTEIGVGYSFFGNFGYYVIVFAAPSVR